MVPSAVVNDFARTLGIEIANDMDIDDDTSLNTTRKGFEAVQKKVKDVMRQGYSASQLMSQVCSDQVVY